MEYPLYRADNQGTEMTRKLGFWILSSPNDFAPVFIIMASRLSERMFCQAKTPAGLQRHGLLPAIYNQFLGSRVIAFACRTPPLAICSQYAGKIFSVIASQETQRGNTAWPRHRNYSRSSAMQAKAQSISSTERLGGILQQNGGFTTTGALQCPACSFRRIAKQELSFKRNGLLYSAKQLMGHFRMLQFAHLLKCTFALDKMLIYLYNLNMRLYVL